MPHAPALHVHDAVDPAARHLCPAYPRPPSDAGMARRWALDDLAIDLLRSAVRVCRRQAAWTPEYVAAYLADEESL